MAQEWNIRPAARQCAACTAPFEEAQQYISALFSGAEAFERRDLCLVCWEGDLAQRQNCFSFWQRSFSAPATTAPKGEHLSRETAEMLLRRLLALEDPANANVAYVLAIMLERKKLLIERDARPRAEGGIVRVYEHRASGDLFVVLDPQLRLNEIALVQEQVIAMLAGQIATDEGA